MKVAVYGNSRQHQYARDLGQFFQLLHRGGAEIIMHAKLYRALVKEIAVMLGPVGRVVEDGEDFTADVALSFGGDGAILRTAMWVGSKEIPILGINTGHLGFLAAASINELPEVAREVLSGDFKTERRSLLQVISPQIGTWPYALNEVAFSKDESASMIEAEICIDSEMLATFRADGLIVSTPTGSTAYNLSVGGPIVEPTAPVRVIAPVAAHALGMRPLVVGEHKKVRVNVRGRARNFRLALDGRFISLPADTTVEIDVAPFGVHLVRRRGHEFFTALRDKLFWSL